MKNRINWPMPIVLALALTGLCFSFYKVLTPTTFSSPPSSPISYLFVPDECGRAEKAHLVTGMLWAPSGKELDVSLVYTSGGSSYFEEVKMESVRGTKVFVGSLPGQDKGKKIFYYIRAKDTDRNEVMIPDGAPEKPMFSVTFKDTPEKWALIAHIVLLIGALFMFFHALYYAFRILGGLSMRKETTRCYRTALVGWIALAVSALPLGIYISYAESGQVWTWKILLAIYWAIPVLLFWKKTIKEKGLSWLIVAGSTLTAVIFLVSY